MNYFNRIIAVSIVVLAISVLGIAQAQAEAVEGQHYNVLPNPQPTQNKDRIEVIEFFWYGCPHCSNLHLPLKNWLKNKPDDVDFRYVPAIFRDNWEPGARTYYALEAMGGMDAVHDKIYDAIHRDKIDLTNEATLFGWMEKQGVEKEAFMKAYNSFAMQSHIARSKQMMQQFQLRGVPVLVVEGKYVVVNKGGTPQDMVSALEKVVVMARKARQ